MFNKEKRLFCYVKFSNKKKIKSYRIIFIFKINSNRTQIMAEKITTKKNVTSSSNSVYF